MQPRKTAIFIDNGYFSKLCIGFGRKDTCFKKITDYIAKENNVADFVVYIYDCMPHQSKKPTRRERELYAKKDRFFSSMKKKGFIIRLGKLQKLPGKKFKQKKVDTLWTADISRLVYTKEIGKAILISGDSDFIPGVEIAKSVCIPTILWYGDTSRTTTSRELRKICDEKYQITKSILDKCKLDSK